MKIQVLFIGKPRSRALNEAADEYAKRLGRYCRFEMAEIKSEAAPAKVSFLNVMILCLLPGAADRSRASLGSLMFTSLARPAVADRKTLSRRHLDHNGAITNPEGPVGGGCAFGFDPGRLGWVRRDRLKGLEDDGSGDRRHSTAPIDPRSHQTLRGCAFTRAV